MTMSRGFASSLTCVLIRFQSTDLITVSFIFATLHAELSAKRHRHRALRSNIRERPPAGVCGVSPAKPFGAAFMSLQAAQPVGCKCGC